MFKPVTLTTKYGEQDITLETGMMARQAGGAVKVTMGETVVLVTCTGADFVKPGTSFLPLTCDYIEKMYAAGRIPGGYFKREGRLAPWEILVARMIDRPNRPLFPKNWRSEIQIIATVLSTDKENDPAICAMVGASAATHISNVPFDGPSAGCRVAKINGELVINPALSSLESASLELVVAGTKDAVVMVEGEAKEASEAEMIEAIDAAHKAMQPVLKIQEQLRKKVGKAKMPVVEEKIDVDLFNKVIDQSVDRLADALAVKEKHPRKEALSAVAKAVIEELTSADEALVGREGEIKGYIKDIQKDIVRTQVLEDGVRIDGRKTTDIRAIDCQVEVLPRTHGSSLFTRGETQALATVTLGTSRDAQRIDNLMGDTTVGFLLHYNFPPYCTGETKFLRGASRREIGHGNLALRGVAPVLPSQDEFPYTIRVVSEVLESNGSSSMATVCASSMALMQAGVPVKKAVAGIAMGLIAEDEDVAVLSDILGDEDHLGDMDFKVVGTKDGITALQMDIKITGLPRKVMVKALEQARKGRLHILKEMSKAIKGANEELSPYSPRIFTLMVKPDRIRDIIGPGGKTIRGIVEQTGVQIEVEDSGRVNIASHDEESANRAIQIIEGLTQEPEVGQIYLGTVRKIMDFGAFVEILPGTDGLVHISELAEERVNKVEDILNEGDAVYVKCIGVDRQGKIKLSRREALEEAAQQQD